MAQTVRDFLANTVQKSPVLEATSGLESVELSMFFPVLFYVVSYTVGCRHFFWVAANASQGHADALDFHHGKDQRSVVI